MQGAAFICEAAPEDVALKQDLLAQLTELADPEAIVASNTSSMPVGLIFENATGLHRPSARIDGTRPTKTLGGALLDSGMTGDIMPASRVLSSA